MVQRRDRQRFTLEALAEQLVARLDRDHAVEARIFGFPYRPHSARPDELDQGVGAELRATL
jgi:hypothetical protein